MGSVVCSADPIIGAQWGSQFTVDANSNLVKCQRCESRLCTLWPEPLQALGKLDVSSDTGFDLPGRLRRYICCYSLFVHTFLLRSFLQGSHVRAFCIQVRAPGTLGGSRKETLGGRQHLAAHFRRPRSTSGRTVLFKMVATHGSANGAAAEFGQRAQRGARCWSWGQLGLRPSC